MEIVFGNVMLPVMKFFLSIGQFVSVECNLMLVPILAVFPLPQQKLNNLTSHIYKL